MRPIALVCCLLLLSGCFARQKWAGGALANTELIAREISPDLVTDVDPLAAAPYIEPPQHLRPCCAFGGALGVSLGTMLLPGVEITNIIDLHELGLHT